MYWPYLVPLIVICASVLIGGTAQMRRTAIAIAVNWTVLTSFVLATGIHSAWWLYLMVDAATAFVILYQPAGKVQALIGWTFMVQIIFHVVFAASNPILADYSYWQILTWIAFVQLALLGGWFVGRWRGYLVRSGGAHLARAHGGARVADE